jgi:hypothetical protein
MEEFAAIESFSIAIAFYHCDRHSFDAFVGGETKVAIQAFTPPSNASPSISGAGFKHPTISILAGRALHARKTPMLFN